VSAVAAAAPDFTSSARLDVLRYSQVWEDHLLLERGLRVGPDDDVLSIGSAGCNVLALLLAEPRSIVAVDASPAQAALIELKLAALRRLPHHDFAVLLGARGGGDRAQLYARVRPELSPAARGWWDAHPEDLRAGAIRRGMLDRYFLAFQEQELSRLVDPRALDRLFRLEDLEHQADLFENEIATPELEAAVRARFGREAMSGSARDESQFRHVEERDMAGFFWSRFRHVCTTLPAPGNFYLEWFLTGRYLDLALGPPYLRPANFERLRDLADRVTVVVEDLRRVLEERPAGAFSKANLSDMFEYMTEDASAELLELLASRMRAGGRIAYWNLLVPRSRPERLADRLVPLREEADTLWARDRVFFYSAFHLDEVTSPEREEGAARPVLPP
jgi:S-adenosylmethionine-diacylglycerol 3-amino-3-carboxypropyl transferase